MKKASNTKHQTSEKLQAPSLEAGPAVAVAPSRKWKVLEYRQCRIDEVLPDPDQPRQVFDQGKLQELAESLKAQGQLEDLLVRAEDGRWVIIDGERRWRAAQLAGLDVVSVKVVDAQRGEVFGAQWTKNQARENLTALEEAEGFRKQIEGGKKAEELAGELGISRASLFGKLRLTRLHAPVRESLVAGRITASVAGEIARLPDRESQVHLLERVQAIEGHENRWMDRGPLPFREVQELIEDEYAKPLKDAPFDLGSTELVPAVWRVSAKEPKNGEVVEAFCEGEKPEEQPKSVQVAKHIAGQWAAWAPPLSGEPFGVRLFGPGPKHEAEAYRDLAVAGPIKVERVRGGDCRTCPHRSGNIDPESKSPNVCTLPTCFAAKCKAHWLAEAKDQASKGVKVLDAAEAKKVRAQYVPGDEQEWAQNKIGTWEELMGKKKPQPVLVATAEGLHKWYPKEEARKAAEANGVKFYQRNGNTAELSPEDKQKAAEERKRQDELRQRREELVQKAAASLARQLVLLSDKEAWELVAELMEGTFCLDLDLEKALVRKDAAPRLRVLGMFLSEDNRLPLDYNNDWDQNTVKLWKRLGVDLVKLEKEQEAGAGAGAAKAEKKPAGKKAKKK